MNNNKLKTQLTNLNQIQTKSLNMIKNNQVKHSKDLLIFKNDLTNAINNLYEWLIYLNSLKTKEISKLNKIKNKVISLIINYVKKSESLMVLNPINIINNKNNLILKASKISKFYCAKKFVNKVLNNISFEVFLGDFVVILGPSGSGKTTLMNLISGLEKPTSGSIFVNNNYLESLDNDKLTLFRKENTGYIFQKYGLLANLTVIENVLMGSYLSQHHQSIKEHVYDLKNIFKQKQKINLKQQIQKYESKTKQQVLNALSILNTLQIEAIKDKYPYELSGGQKQRVAIARMIAKKTKIIFADEPTAAVDYEMSKNILNAFIKINKEFKTTLIMITHDQSIANFANKVIYLKDGVIDKIIQNN